jgi:hypothetical protein
LWPQHGPENHDIISEMGHLVGKHGDTDKYLKNAVTKAEILKEEKNSESCGIP